MITGRMKCCPASLKPAARILSRSGWASTRRWRLHGGWPQASMPGRLQMWRAPVMSPTMRIFPLLTRNVLLLRVCARIKQPTRRRAASRWTIRTLSRARSSCKSRQSAILCRTCLRCRSPGASWTRCMRCPIRGGCIRLTRRWAECPPFRRWNSPSSTTAAASAGAISAPFSCIREDASPRAARTAFCTRPSF